ncbi:MAG: hypothetical protein EA369_09860 [Bradymonadales bacterium]|nr:MAG: hypothetical protein EA369_09860 [Bradymonadales bacterium]
MRGFGLVFGFFGFSAFSLLGGGVLSLLGAEAQSSWQPQWPSTMLFFVDEDLSPADRPIANELIAQLLLEMEGRHTQAVSYVLMGRSPRYVARGTVRLDELRPDLDSFWSGFLDRRPNNRSFKMSLENLIRTRDNKDEDRPWHLLGGDRNFSFVFIGDPDNFETFLDSSRSEFQGFSRGFLRGKSRPLVIQVGAEAGPGLVDQRLSQDWGERLRDFESFRWGAPLYRESRGGQNFSIDMASIPSMDEISDIVKAFGALALPNVESPVDQQRSEVARSWTLEKETQSERLLRKEWERRERLARDRYIQGGSDSSGSQVESPAPDIERQIQERQANQLNFQEDPSLSNLKKLPIPFRLVSPQVFDWRYEIHRGRGGRIELRIERPASLLDLELLQEMPQAMLLDLTTKAWFELNSIAEAGRLEADQEALEELFKPLGPDGVRSRRRGSFLERLTKRHEYSFVVEFSGGVTEDQIRAHIRDFTQRNGLVDRQRLLEELKTMEPRDRLRKSTLGGQPIPLKMEEIREILPLPLRLVHPQELEFDYWVQSPIRPLPSRSFDLVLELRGPVLDLELLSELDSSWWASRSDWSLQELETQLSNQKLEELQRFWARKFEEEGYFFSVQTKNGRLHFTFNPRNSGVSSEGVIRMLREFAQAEGLYDVSHLRRSAQEYRESLRLQSGQKWRPHEAQRARKNMDRSLRELFVSPVANCNL